MEEHKATVAASAPAKAAKVEKKRPEKTGPVMGGKKGSKRA